MKGSRLNEKGMSCTLKRVLIAGQRKNKFGNPPSPMHFVNQIYHQKIVVPTQGWGLGWI